MCLLSLALGGSCALAAEPEVPETFLPSTGHLRQVLDRPVSGTFNNAPVEDVIETLRIRSQIRVNLSLMTGTTPLPKFSGTFEDTPFRTALYRVVHATGLKATIKDRGDGVLVIVISPAM